METVTTFPAQSGADSERLRLISYNVHVGIAASKYRHYLLQGWKHFLPFRHRLKNMNNIARVIKAFDIVGLQELDSGSLRSGYVNHAQYLADKADFPHWYDHTNRRWGKMAQHSMGILSRYEGISVHRHNLPSRVPGRGALMVQFGTPEDPLVLLLVHLSLSSKARVKQMEYISRLIREYTHVIVMGDFNCGSDSREMSRFISMSGLHLPAAHMLTYPSWNPKLHIDHILVSGSIHIRKAKVLPYRQSDHLPVAVEVVLPRQLSLGIPSPWSGSRVA
ncbi:MAG: endonuclease/exonuclease/phosphatase family protein [Desulfomonilia bacterium]